MKKIKLRFLTWVAIFMVTAASINIIFVEAAEADTSPVFSQESISPRTPPIEDDDITRP
ncbi:MAG: hypothetical protein FWE34_04120 [Defluviitaleaceae bacterium]|nr:hypothetical protein [Defluviitaleaceae bacterium]